MKLFEIPVYSISREVLKQRVDNTFQKFFQTYGDIALEKKRAFDMAFFPH